MSALKFRVLLDSTTHEIFRDILIDENSSFETFYKAILDAYQFSDDQMASFYMSNENWDRGYEISLFDMAFGEDPDQIMPGVMNTCILADYMNEPDQKIILVHDFIRMWIFLIELIGIEETKLDHPKVVLSVGNAPSESSRSGEEDDLRFETDSDEEFEEDEFGFDDFEEGYEDYGDYDF
ncbi:MAG: hypothetical protein EP333_09625 [Bacteroidetes bacterium]|nr:MAG: hypothetical protein EP333_09625 [Bacteroidota bacterium]TNE98464.1 MAG: hypothetical protein EP322_04890 [Bacteroidota bacterium]